MKEIKERKTSKTTIDLKGLEKNELFKYAIRFSGFNGLVLPMIQAHMNSLKPEFDNLSKEEKAKFK